MHKKSYTKKNLCLRLGKDTFLLSILNNANFYICTKLLTRTDFIVHDLSKTVLNIFSITIELFSCNFLIFLFFLVHKKSFDFSYSENSQELSLSQMHSMPLSRTLSKLLSFTTFCLWSQHKMVHYVKYANSLDAGRWQKEWTY